MKTLRWIVNDKLEKFREPLWRCSTLHILHATSLAISFKRVIMTLQFHKYISCFHGICRICLVYLVADLQRQKRKKGQEICCFMYHLWVILTSEKNISADSCIGDCSSCNPH